MAKKNIKSIIKEFVQVSTLYGIPNLFRSKSLYQKILWSFFILTSTASSYFLINETVFDYLDHKVVTVIQSIYEQPTEFPTVTICGYFDDYFKDKLPSEVFKELFFGYNHQCTNNPNNCFDRIFARNHCFRFNSGKNFTNHSIPIEYSTTGGSDDSLVLSVNKSIDMAVWVHNKSSPPRIEFFNSHDYTRVFATSNSFTHIIVKKIVEVKLPEPYNQCLDDVNKFKFNKTIIDYIYRLNQTYTQQKCLEFCFDVYYIENNTCNCTGIEIGNIWKHCWNEMEKKQRYSCTWEYKLNFYSESIAKKCAKYCPLECTTVSYEIRSSSILNYNSTAVKIYYADLKYTLITQEPKINLVDLISNIGGTFGLLIGFSFVTFFEVFEIIAEIIANKLNRNI